MSAVNEAVKAALEQPLKLDIGCGKNKKEGFYGIDIYDFDGVDMVADLREPTWSFSRIPDELGPRLNQVVISDDRLRITLPDNSVDEVHCAHFLEHLTNLGERWERVNFFNELYRVMKPGAKALVIFPHWNSNRYYGDPTHKEPFSEMGFYYLRRAWRMGDGTPQYPVAQAPHTDISVNPNGYSCDFDATWGYSLNGSLHTRHEAYVRFAMENFKESCQDMMATLVKPETPR